MSLLKPMSALTKRQNEKRRNIACRGAFGGLARQAQALLR